MYKELINDCEKIETYFEEGIDKNWKVMKHQWGIGNGGCIPENVKLGLEGVELVANGDFYTGSIRGLNHDKTRGKNGKRTGAALISSQMLGPGSFEICMKPCSKFGVCTAFWTWYGNEEINHEIDMELPGRIKKENPTFEIMLNNTWLTEEKCERRCVPIKEAIDGNFHTFRFDWHTQPEKVEFYYDGKLVQVNTKNIPTVKMNITFGAWFPHDWAGKPDFDSSEMKVRYVKYIPFKEKCKEIFPNPADSLGILYDNFKDENHLTDL